ncbi:MAG TPA: metal ABC transporter substrate-binding protein [Acidimicrobiales bacterium]|nr:metal ABC transporter substrate-binding protein [Acidimicrobiales bacterium]
MRTVLSRVGAGLAVLGVAAGAAACGDDDTGGADAAPIVVTSSIAGDVVRNLVGGDVAIEVLMPPNADPHDFAPSARQASHLRDADVVVVNGLGFEAGLDDAIDAAGDDGAAVVALAELAPDLLGDDPHVFTDPARMAVATAALAEELADTVEGLDTPAYRERATAYVEDLEALDAEVEQVLASIPAERRVLVTNHDVFGYFAERYGFEVLGSIIPGGDTLAEPSADELADLAAAIDAAGVPAIFAESSAPTRLADALAGEGADVEVVELYTESLGEPGSGADTYVELVRTNAQRIAAALA